MTVSVWAESRRHGRNGDSELPWFYESAPVI